MRISSEEKQVLVARYQAGESVAEICADTGVARSTFYTWIKAYSTTTTDSGVEVNRQEYIKMKQRIQKLELKIEILQKVGCAASSPLQEKLQELEKLYGQYSVHALCEALCVSRGTFYNHIFRRKEVTVYDKRRAAMKEHIQEVFDERRQRLGANKIAAVLASRGIPASQKYVMELMREMGIESITRNSKRDYRRRERLSIITSQSFCGMVFPFLRVLPLDHGDEFVVLIFSQFASREEDIDLARDVIQRKTLALVVFDHTGKSTV